MTSKGLNRMSSKQKKNLVGTRKKSSRVKPYRKFQLKI